MITTSQVNYPVLIAGKHGFFGFCEHPQKLIEKTDHLRWIADADWLKLVDRDFNLYRMSNLTVVRGAGRFGGYFFKGPFLGRKVVYRADLQPLQKLRIDEVAEIILGFMRTAQGFRKRDEIMFRAKLAEASNDLNNLDDVKTFYESLKWGDQAEDNDEDE